MNNFKRALVAAVLAGSMALTFSGAASADGPKPGSSVPTGTMTFFVDGTPTASFNPYEIAVVEKVPFTSQRPQAGIPTGTVTFTIDGPQAQGVRANAYLDLTFEKGKHIDAQPDNEWKYVPIRR